jgi:RNA polymerase sigma-70 factor (ECF subfamily)
MESQPSQETRGSLLERMRNWQDRDSWQDFFDTYWKLIYSTARKTGLSDAEAQDVVQKTLISVSRRFPSFRYDAAGSFRAWLRRLTKWRVLDQIRERLPAGPRYPDNLDADERTSELIENMPDPASLVPNQIWERDWQKNLAEVALARVRPRVEPLTYQLYDFYVTKDWPAKKVAERFGVVVARVHLAKCRLTAMLKQEVARLEKDTF